MPIHTLTPFEKNQLLILIITSFYALEGKRKCSAEFAINYTPLVMESALEPGSFELREECLLRYEMVIVAGSCRAATSGPCGP